MKKYDLKGLIRKQIAMVLNSNLNSLSIASIASSLDIGIYTARIIFSELKRVGIVSEDGAIIREKAVEFLENSG
jgi:hypothetical protein